jgi:hypothetical protein
MGKGMNKIVVQLSWLRILSLQNIHYAYCETGYVRVGAVISKVAPEVKCRNYQS